MLTCASAKCTARLHAHPDAGTAIAVARHAGERVARDG
jgi:hypothetical protein